MKIIVQVTFPDLDFDLELLGQRAQIVTLDFYPRSYLVQKLPISCVLKQTKLKVQTPAPWNHGSELTVCGGAWKEGVGGAVQAEEMDHHGYYLEP